MKLQIFIIIKANGTLVPVKWKKDLIKLKNLYQI